jgi:hypothetical protein
MAGKRRVFGAALKAKGVRTPPPPLQPLIASAGGSFPSPKEAQHGTRCGSEEAGRVATSAGSV